MSPARARRTACAVALCAFIAVLAMHGTSAHGALAGTVGDNGPIGHADQSGLSGQPGPSDQLHQSSRSDEADEADRHGGIPAPGGHDIAQLCAFVVLAGLLAGSATRPSRRLRAAPSALPPLVQGRPDPPVPRRLVLLSH